MSVGRTTNVTSNPDDFPAEIDCRTCGARIKTRRLDPYMKTYFATTEQPKALYARDDAEAHAKAKAGEWEHFDSREQLWEATRRDRGPFVAAMYFCEVCRASFQIGVGSRAPIYIYDTAQTAFPPWNYDKIVAWRSARGLPSPPKAPPYHYSPPHLDPCYGLTMEGAPR